LVPDHGSKNRGRGTQSISKNGIKNQNCDMQNLEAPSSKNGPLMQDNDSEVEMSRNKKARKIYLDSNGLAEEDQSYNTLDANEESTSHINKRKRNKNQQIDHSD